MVATATLLILTYPCFLLIGQGSFLAAVVGQVLLAIPASATAANLLAAQTEMFPTRIRYTAYAIAMNVGVALFGGTAPFVATYLISATGSNLAPAFYLMFAAALLADHGPGNDGDGQATAGARSRRSRTRWTGRQAS